MSASHFPEKGPPADSGASQANSNDNGEYVDINGQPDLTAGSQALHRKLRGREVQLFAIGGAIGTCMSDLHPECAC
jgi:amino acid transporter